jgi:D-glycero-alpha-D-manno-heptose-7-phosphate kinase
LAEIAASYLRAGKFDEFGRLLDLSWTIKKRLANGISNQRIDEIYAAVRRAGALGGKICGAGGGGFLLVYAPPFRQDAVRRALREVKELPFQFEPDGTKVVIDLRESQAQTSLSCAAAG